MLPSVLIVDDEVEVLKALTRLLHHDYQVTCFTQPSKALAFFENSPCHIVISDLMMPEINGAEFLMKIAAINSRCKRIALTGFASVELAKKAINDGQVSHYLTKPWNNDQLKALLAELVLQLKQENKKQAFLKRLSLDNKQLNADQQSNALMYELLVEEQADTAKQIHKLKAMYSKEVSGHSLRVAELAKALAMRLSQQPNIGRDIYIAGLYHRIGIASLSEELATKVWQQRSAKEDIDYMSYVQDSAQIMATVSMLKQSASIVGSIYEQVNGHGVPNKLSAEQIPLGARILRLVIYFDLLIAGEITGKRMTVPEAFTALKQQLHKQLDADVFKVFQQMYLQPTANEKIQLCQPISVLVTGMEIAQDLLDSQHHKLLAEGTQLTASHIEHLQTIEQQQDYPLFAFVYNS